MTPEEREAMHAISTHALREEGDRGGNTCTSGAPDFYPRPP